MATELSKSSNPTLPPPGGKSAGGLRLEWLDALRGFTMLLVVMYHVFGMSFSGDVPKGTAITVMMLFRMPTFFFISGFLAYKASRVWDGHTLRELSLKKMRVQLIPTIVFFLLFLAMIPTTPFVPSLMEALASSMKAGYWFTLVLLYMLLTFYAFSYVESKIFRRHEGKGAPPILIILLFIISLCFFETCYLPRYFSWALGHKGPQNEFLNYSSLVEMFRYFPFFLYGTIVHRYWDQAQRLMDSRWFYPVVLALAVVMSLEVIKWHTLHMEWASMPHTLAMFLLLSIVFMFFRHEQAFFGETRFGKGLQFIGRRTLDIYLLHYFFLPKLPMVGLFFFTNRHNFLLDTTASLLVALVIVAFCIITSQLIRVSPFLKKYLFGR